MYARTGFSLFSALLFFSLASQAVAERRVALVIGNSAYTYAQKLPNTPNDAAAMSVLLEGAGFQVVETRSDLGNMEMRRIIRDFSEMTRDADMAVVFYAGHGIEVDGINFLIPTDAKLERDIDIEDEAIALDRVVKMLEPAKNRLVILDACRDNPFAGAMKRTMVSRSVGRGLAKIEPTMSDTLIAFAAKAGSIAADGDGLHSPFTAALLRHITTPGLDLRLVFGRVRDDVIETTGNRQEPYVYGSLGGANVALVPALAPAPAFAALPSAAPVTVGPAPAPAADPAWREYELAARVNDKETWDAFLEAHPTGFYANLARAQRAKLIAMAPVVAPVAKAPVAALPGVDPVAVSPSQLVVPGEKLAGEKLASVKPEATPSVAAPIAPPGKLGKAKNAKKKEKEKRRNARVRDGDGEVRGGRASNPHCDTIRHAIRAAKSAGFVDSHGLMSGASRYCGGRG